MEPYVKAPKRFFGLMILKVGKDGSLQKDSKR